MLFWCIIRCLRCASLVVEFNCVRLLSGPALAKLGWVGHPWWVIDSVQSTLSMHSMLLLGGPGGMLPQEIF